jgi:translation elongation factor EF-1alpha
VARSGPSLLQFLDEMQPLERMADHPLRMPIAEKYKVRHMQWELESVQVTTDHDCAGHGPCDDGQD